MRSCAEQWYSNHIQPVSSDEISPFNQLHVFRLNALFILSPLVNAVYWPTLIPVPPGAIFQIHDLGDDGGFIPLRCCKLCLGSVQQSKALSLVSVSSTLFPHSWWGRQVEGCPETLLHRAPVPHARAFLCFWLENYVTTSTVQPYLLGPCKSTVCHIVLLERIAMNLEWSNLHYPHSPVSKFSRCTLHSGFLLTDCKLTCNMLWLPWKQCASAVNPYMLYPSYSTLLRSHE